MINILVNTSNTKKLYKDSLPFPLLYFWFKDHYYQNSKDNFLKTQWKWVDSIHSIQLSMSDISNDPPDIAAFSLYIWNYDLILENVRHIKKQYPNCLVVVGGPSAEATDDFFNNNPGIDIVVLGPGAEIFRQIVDSVVEQQDYRSIDGIAYYNKVVIKNPPMSRARESLNLNYVNNFKEETIATLDQLSRNTQSIVFFSIFRQGCPYTCSFCEQGTSLWTKVLHRPKEYVYDEIDLISNYKSYFYSIDSNIGIHQDDESIIDYLIDAKKNKNSQIIELTNPSYAKNNVDRIFYIIKKLKYSGVSIVDGAISIQDLNQEVLDFNGRPNEKDAEKIAKFTNFVKDIDYPFVAVDMILGMPGQTEQSVTDTIFDLIFIKNIRGSFVPTLYLKLPNTPLNEDKKYSTIKTRNLHYREIDPWTYLTAIDQVDDPYVSRNVVVSSHSFNENQLASMYYIYGFMLHANKYKFFDPMFTYLENYYNISKEILFKNYAKHFYSQNRNKLPEKLNQDIESLYRWFSGKQKYIDIVDNDGIGYVGVETLTNYRLLANTNDFIDLLRKTTNDLIGNRDPLVEEILNWTFCKTGSLQHKYPVSIVSYNFDDLVSKNSDVFYKSKFVFNYNLNNKQDLLKKLVDNQDVPYVPYSIEHFGIDPKLNCPMDITNLNK